MLVLGTTILIMQAVFMPVGMVYAETIDIEEQEKIELPPMKNYLEEEPASNPRFFFTRSWMQGTAEEPMQVTFFSDQKVSEVRVFLPEEATLMEDQLPPEISVEQGEHPHEWIVLSKRAQKTFVLPLSFEEEGTYDLFVENTKSSIVIHGQKLVNSEKNQLASSDSDRQLLFEKMSLVDASGNVVAGKEITLSDVVILDRITQTQQPLNINAGTYQGLPVDLRFSRSGSIVDTSATRPTITFISQTGGFPIPGESQITLSAYYSGTDVMIDAPLLIQISAAGTTAHTRIRDEFLYNFVMPANLHGPIELYPAYQGPNPHTFTNRANHFRAVYKITNGATITLARGQTTSQNVFTFENPRLMLPTPSFSLSMQASPVEGGNPTSSSADLTQGSITTIDANPNPEFDFVRWEVISGTGAIISEVDSESTSLTMGSSDLTLQAIYQKKQGAMVTVEYVDDSLNEIAEKEYLNGFIGESYQSIPKEINGYTLNSNPENATGIFTDQQQLVTYTYIKDQVTPLDPIDPDIDVDPENKPELPEDQGLLSIDFVSSFSFGSQVISAHDQNYYAKPQRLLNEDGTVNENEKRPNYVQISDRRSEDERNGWQLAVTQNEQFENSSGHELSGARLRFTNQELVATHNGTAPELQQTNPLQLVPNAKRVLLMAQGNEGTGTWIYRFGDLESADKSIVLEVPKETNPEATSYVTTLTWELSAVPGN